MQEGTPQRDCTAESQHQRQLEELKASVHVSQDLEPAAQAAAGTGSGQAKQQLERLRVQTWH
jgi:hypothetical protein